MSYFCHFRKLPFVSLLPLSTRHRFIFISRGKCFSARYAIHWSRRFGVCLCVCVLFGDPVQNTTIVCVQRRVNRALAFLNHILIAGVLSGRSSHKPPCEKLTSCWRARLNPNLAQGYGAALGWRRPDGLSLGEVAFWQRKAIRYCMYAWNEVIITFCFQLKPPPPPCFIPPRDPFAMASANFVGSFSRAICVL